MRPIHLSIKTKLILYFLVSILLPATLVSVIFYIDSVNDYSVLITLNTELQNIISSPQPHDDEAIVNEIVQRYGQTGNRLAASGDDVGVP